MVTVLTRTIGPSGRDYASFTLAEADVTNIGTSADLVANDEAIVFEADAGTYNETVAFSSTLTTDATRNVTYKSASGSEHGGDPESGPIIQDASAATAALMLYDHYTAFDGLVVKKVAPGSNRTIRTMNAATDGIVFRNLIVENTGAHTQRAFEVAGSGILYENIVVTDTVDAFRYLGGTGQSHTHINCTIISALRGYYNLSGGGTVKIVNALNLDVTTNYYFPAGWTASGSNNFGGSGGAFPAAIQGSPYPITATTDTDPGAGDFALYVGKNGALLDSPNNDVIDQGVGPSANSDVPTTDILGNARSGATANPGAFEQPQATATITKTIGPSGRDYTTFALAEADVANIGGSADLVNENERIVFEADAADYSGNFQFYTAGALTCDATRNVTWTHAAGAEHGGQFESGANIVGYCLIQEDYAVVDGLSVSPSSGFATQIANGIAGPILRNLMSYSTNSNAIKLQLGGTASEPGVAENCVAKSGSSRPWDIRSEGAGSDAYWRVVNNTAIPGGSSQGFIIGISSSDTIYLEATNNLILGTRGWFEMPSGYTLSLTGSNNFGPASNPVPSAIAGSPNPITATTNTNPGAGDWAIYDASNGSLVNDVDNDVLRQGAGPAVDADVPTSDINGTPRVGGTCDPGAFEVTPGLASIGAGFPDGGYAAVGTFDVEPDTFPIQVEEQIPAYSSPDTRIFHRRSQYTSETAFGYISRRRWTLRYSYASAAQYTRVLELYRLTKAGVLGLNWTNSYFTRGGAAETVLVRMVSQPLKVSRRVHNRYSFRVVLEEMSVGP